MSGEGVRFWRNGDSAIAIIADRERCIPGVQPPPGYTEYVALDPATHAALVAKAAERDRLTTCGVAELAAMNPNLASYCREWESRAERAEAKERPEIVNALKEILLVREERDAAVAVTTKHVEAVDAAIARATSLDVDAKLRADLDAAVARAERVEGAARAFAGYIEAFSGKGDLVLPVGAWKAYDALRAALPDATRAGKSDGGGT